MTLKMYKIRCKLLELVVVSLVLFLVNLGISNGFKCFLIAKYNSFTIIDDVLFVMP
jgi:hypothetical protein